MVKSSESDEFMRTTAERDEKMRQTLIPGRRDGQQWVAGRGVSTSECVTDTPTSKRRTIRFP